VLVLIAVGLAAGVITALSPCVLPVLPIVLAGGVSGRRPLAIVAGLVGSFTVFTLGAAWLLDLLGLPDDFLRNLAIALLVLVALTMLWPASGEWLSRRLSYLGRRPSHDVGGGLLLGASMGLVFVPCAGPVLAAVTVLAAKGDVGLRAIVLTLAYATGAAIPLLAVALLGRRASDTLRSRAEAVRIAAGGLLLAAALAIALGVDKDLQTKVPGYTQALQDRIERSSGAERRLFDLTGARRPVPVSTPAATGGGATAVRAVALPDYGPAPAFAGLDGWINTDPLTLRGLRGKVVLIDFWTYSCVNCLRTLPFVRAWAERYRASGLVVVGVHSPEFAFEKVPANVRENVRRLSIRYPVALDSRLGTWTAWHNQYWPAKYLIDRRGHVRYYHFGEGEYDRTEQAIRQLLAEGVRHLPARTHGADRTPTGTQTPESYLGYERLARYAGNDTIAPDELHRYTLPARLGSDELAYGGLWRVEWERIVAGRGARLGLRFRADAVHLVLGGRGTVRVLVDGKERAPARVDGDRLYTLVRLPAAGEHLLELRFTPGVEAYAFTFG
jgi:cytochrome c biogenesis protein CcdA/thiol-disulfide isomerase/thioredoxin